MLMRLLMCNVWFQRVSCVFTVLAACIDTVEFSVRGKAIILRVVHDSLQLGPHEGR
jgi:hypothetical protein